MDYSYLKGKHSQIIKKKETNLEKINVKYQQQSKEIKSLEKVGEQGSVGF